MGIPPPGWAEPEARNNPGIDEIELLGRVKAANRLLEDEPYIAPLEPGNCSAKSAGVLDHLSTADFESMLVDSSRWRTSCSTIVQSVDDEPSAGSGGVLIITKMASVPRVVRGR